jgi:hypothetical protein
VDSNAGIYGTWNGTLTETSPGPSVQQYGITVTLAKGSVAFYLGSAQFPATLVSMQDPSVVFDVTNGSTSVRYTGTRAGSTMNGAGVWPSGNISDVWALTKASPATLPIAVTRQRDPRFGARSGIAARGK